MEQHPIPQQISSYEFKLVGDMTLKQFGKAAGGVVIAVLINSSKLIFLIKYPLMALFGLGGIMMAFVPFQDRPLETWLLAFIKSIYSPTFYLWKKVKDKNWLDIDMTKKGLEEYEGKDDLEVSAKDEEKVNEFIGSLPKLAFGNKTKDVELSVEDYKTEEKKQEKITEKPQPDKQIVEKEAQPKSSPSSKENWRDKKTDLNLKRADKLEATGDVVFGGVPMPVTPKIANVLSGMVTGKDGQIVEEAIVEVQDGKGNPVRVFRTNSLGQFKSANQLANGKYLIITEKEGYEFYRVEIELRGEILEPVKIQAK
ncbi:PrgI family protein [Patescibacteria group bacterium]|nr:PrgI family protein [Patescibacteria group bacterium]MCG2701684.1 PrgI family protein [Candidatus Parcubacteria bacterium]MBU4210082.1 PrgI family protein [Patescibacteria group bacterium]MBU4265381.1 PrgI family protein [Patescibacteria group bacterium]MBU4390333.1 PrgI family protein [Patescibacteria group bacterium]